MTDIDDVELSRRGAMISDAVNSLVIEALRVRDQHARQVDALKAEIDEVRERLRQTCADLDAARAKAVDESVTRAAESANADKAMAALRVVTAERDALHEQSKATTTILRRMQIALSSMGVFHRWRHGCEGSDREWAQQFIKDLDAAVEWSTR